MNKKVLAPLFKGPVKDQGFLWKRCQRNLYQPKTSSSQTIAITTLFLKTYLFQIGFWCVWRVTTVTVITVAPARGLFIAQTFVFLSGIDVISWSKAASKPFISRFFGGSIPSLGTTPISLERTHERRGLTLLGLTKAALRSTLYGKALNGTVVKNAKKHLSRVSNHPHHLGASTPAVWWLASSPFQSQNT